MVRNGFVVWTLAVLALGLAGCDSFNGFPTSNSGEQGIEDPNRQDALDDFDDGVVNYTIWVRDRPGEENVLETGGVLLPGTLPGLFSIDEWTPSEVTPLVVEFDLKFAPVLGSLTVLTRTDGAAFDDFQPTPRNGVQVTFSAILDRIFVQRVSNDVAVDLLSFDFPLDRPFTTFGVRIVDDGESVSVSILGVDDFFDDVTFEFTATALAPGASAINRVSFFSNVQELAAPILGGPAVAIDNVFLSGDRRKIVP